MLFEMVFSGQSLWNTPYLIGVTCVAVLYIILLKAFTKTKIYQKQPLLFFISLFLFYVTIASPLSAMGHLSFSMHMIQMSILYFIIPPVFLLGIPEPLFQKIRKIRFVRGVSKFFLPPMISLIVFAVLFFIYHLPIVLNVILEYSFLHNGYMLLLIALSFSTWWPLASPDPKQRYCKGQRKRYAFLNGMILMPACLLFIFSAFIDGVSNPNLMQLTLELCLPSSSSAQELFPSPFNMKYDQQLAGIFMLGMHKFGLKMTSHFGNKVLDPWEEKECSCVLPSFYHHRFMKH